MCTRVRVVDVYFPRLSLLCSFGTLRTSAAKKKIFKFNNSTFPYCLPKNNKIRSEGQTDVKSGNVVTNIAESTHLHHVGFGK